MPLSTRAILIARRNLHTEVRARIIPHFAQLFAHQYPWKMSAPTENSWFSFYPYQFTVQLRKRLRHGTCVG